MVVVFVDSSNVGDFSGVLGSSTLIEILSVFPACSFFSIIGSFVTETDETEVSVVVEEESCSSSFIIIGSGKIGVETGDFFSILILGDNKGLTVVDVGVTAGEFMFVFLI